MKNIVLILLLVVGVFASESEEIGVPYVERKSGMFYSASFAPDGKSFYTQIGDLITHWQLSPVKKLSSFRTGLKVETKTEKNRRYFNPTYNIHVTYDGKRMILSSRKALILWDLETKKQIKKVDVIHAMGAIDGDKFLTIDRNMSRRSKLIEWDSNSLTKLRSEYLPYNGFVNDPYALIVGEKSIYTIGQEAISIIDKKTYKQVYLGDSLGIYAAYDNSYMYYSYDIPYATKMPDLAWKAINTSTDEIEVMEDSKVPKRLNRSWVHYISNYLISLYTRTSNKSLSLAYRLSLVTALPKIRYFFFDRKTNKLKATFFQFKDEAWVMLGANGNFEMSKNAKKYLKMIVPDGTIVPMNDATFEKYNKKINLEG